MIQLLHKNLKERRKKKAIIYLKTKFKKGRHQEKVTEIGKVFLNSQS